MWDWIESITTQVSNLFIHERDPIISLTIANLTISNLSDPIFYVNKETYFNFHSLWFYPSKNNINKL